jgi:hypothetical protein
MHKLLPKFCFRLSNYQVDNPAHAVIFKSTLFNAAILPTIPSLDSITSQSAYTDHDNSSIRPYAPLDLPHPEKEISHCLSKAANEMSTQRHAGPCSCMEKDPDRYVTPEGSFRASGASSPNDQYKKGSVTQRADTLPWIIEGIEKSS